MAPRKITHHQRCRMKLRINPGVTRIKPDGEMAAFAPRRSSGLDDLLCRMCRQILTRRGEPEILFVCRLPNELFQEDWSFEPPVPKQFRIERSDNNRIKPEFTDFANLLAALFQKVDRMLCCRLFGRRPMIKLFVITA